MHRVAAHIMVIAVFWHRFHVFYRGGYRPPHEFNWAIGVVLLLLTLLLSYTGYLLPWDQHPLCSAFCWTTTPLPVAWRKSCGRERAAAVLCSALRHPSVTGCFVDRSPLLAHSEGWWSDTKR